MINLNLKLIKSPTLALSLISFLSLLYLFIFSPSAQALSTDNDQPAHLVADHVVYNYKDGITIFTGNVKLDQGTTHLTADQLTTYRNKDGKIDKAVAIGNPAHYSTLPDNQDQVVDVLGDKIEYYPLDKKAVVIGNGTITQGPNRFNGAHIVYDMDKQVVTSLPTPGNQSVIILQPQNLPGQTAEKKPADNKQ